MGQNYSRFLEKIQQIHDLEKALQLMSWDRDVNMPPAGAEIRTEQMATISKMIHELRSSDEMGELLAAAEEDLYREEADYDSTEASLVRYIRRDFEERRLIPADYVRRASEANGRAIPAWKKAREENDFASYAPHLKGVIELVQEEVEYRGYEDEKYDAMLDQYERGMKTAEVRAIFQAVRDATQPLMEAIKERVDAVDDGFLFQPYPVEQQQAIAPFFARAVGYDFNRGHLGTATHPFATSFNRNDARITTRWNPNFLSPFIFGVMHECGHALYEHGTGAELKRTPLARGTSMGFHESQSRLFENMVGRSLGFWQTHFKVLQDAFPGQLADVTVAEFYRGINRVKPSFIRVEADELTYNLHILLRFELEQAMLEGDLQAGDLPAAWNEKMRALLGVVPPTDREGCLQDIHWTRPGFGYFPTYALGNFYAAQIMEAALHQEPAIQEELQAGRVDALLGWLIENIHHHGKKYDPAELAERATGRRLDPKPFITYVWDKFGAIYDLN